MKKMISCIAAMAMIASFPTQTVFAADEAEAYAAAVEVPYEAAEAEEAYDISELENIDEIFIKKMNDMNILLMLTQAISDEKKLSSDYINISDIGYTSIQSVTRLINDTCTGKLKQQLFINARRCLREEDGELYCRTNDRAYSQFPTNNGIKISFGENNSINAVTKSRDRMNNYGKAIFENEYGEWKISSYEFGEAETCYSVGDLNNDNNIDAIDASTVLSLYTMLSTNNEGKIDSAVKAAADVNNDGSIDAVDASCILSYYSYISTTDGNVADLIQFQLK